MYIDSDFGMQAASDLVVAKELQDHVEPLLMVNILLFLQMHPLSLSLLSSLLSLSSPLTAIQGGLGFLGTPSFLSEDVPRVQEGMPTRWDCSSSCRHWDGGTVPVTKFAVNDDCMHALVHKLKCKNFIFSVEISSQTGYSTLM